MRHWRTSFALILVLGLASMPFTAHAHEEEGSMSGQETHDIQGKQVRGGMKQETGAKGEARKENVTDHGIPGAHHDSHGGHNDSHEQREEGSH